MPQGSSRSPDKIKRARPHTTIRATFDEWSAREIAVHVAHPQPRAREQVQQLDVQVPPHLKGLHERFSDT